MSPPLRIAIVASHPVQYQAPIFQRFARDSRLQIQVAYCGMQGAELQHDPGFGMDVKWDIPLLEGYPWMHLPDGLTLWRLIRSGNFDAVVLFTGYVCWTFWIALAAAKLSRTPVLFGTDAFEIVSRDATQWRRWAKTRLWRWLFRLADVVIVVSSGGASLMHSLGIPENRIAITPYCVNNEWWIEQANKADRERVRMRWDVPSNSIAILFCAKLQMWKRPHDLLRAFKRIADLNCYLVFAGDGPLRSSLESEAQSLGIASKVRFLGFVNQSGLPETYGAADVLVLPSAYEPFGVVVNEAMLCRCPVIVSDRVGARFDLVNDETGFVFPAGDVEALSTLLSKIVSNRESLTQMGNAARRRMIPWSPERLVDATIEAITTAVTLRGKDHKRLQQILNGNARPRRIPR